MQQVAEENGLDVVNKLEEHPVSSKIPTVDTLTHEQEEKLSRRYISLIFIVVAMVTNNVNHLIILLLLS